jgi:hypothetical protein
MGPSEKYVKAKKYIAVYADINDVLPANGGYE